MAKALAVALAAGLIKGRARLTNVERSSRSESIYHNPTSPFFGFPNLVDLGCGEKQFIAMPDLLSGHFLGDGGPCPVDR